MKLSKLRHRLAMSTTSSLMASILAAGALTVSPHANSGQAAASFVASVSVNRGSKLPPLEQLCRDGRTHFLGAIVECRPTHGKSSERIARPWSKGPGATAAEVSY